MPSGLRARAATVRRPTTMFQGKEEANFSNTKETHSLIQFGTGKAQAEQSTGLCRVPTYTHTHIHTTGAVRSRR